MIASPNSEPIVVINHEYNHLSDNHDNSDSPDEMIVGYVAVRVIRIMIMIVVTIMILAVCV